MFVRTGGHLAAGFWRLTAGTSTAPANRSSRGAVPVRSTGPHHRAQSRAIETSGPSWYGNMKPPTWILPGMIPPLRSRMFTTARIRPRRARSPINRPCGDQGEHESSRVIASR
jgi:hypothetical protein